MLLEYFHRGLGPKNRSLSDHFFPGYLTKRPYKVVVKHLDRYVKANKGIEKCQDWANLLTQLDDLSMNFIKLEVSANTKSRHIPPRKCKKMKLHEGG